MDTAALIAWATTAFGGSYLLITWLVHGGLRQQRTKATNFPAPLLFGHFLLATSGLAMWIGYVVSAARILAWAALFTLVLIALFGLIMFARWGAGYHIPPAAATNTPPDTMAAAVPARMPAGVTRDRRTPAGGSRERRTPAGRDGKATITAREEPEPAAESHFPTVVVAGHGAFATATIVLVLLATLGVGGS